MHALPSLADAIRLDPAACAALREDSRRIAIVGASGWIGRALAAGLFDALGEEEARERLMCFGSSERAILFGDGRSLVQQPLARMANLSPRPTMVFHLAFLTKDKIAGMSESDYVQANRTLSGTVLKLLGGIGADRVFVASSGAAAFADKADAATDVRLYGRLKRDDELAFEAWAGADAGRRAVIGRIYSLAGPFINKHETYALASFILDALSHRPIEVKARNRVVRSYVAVRELLSVAIMELLAEPGDDVVQFDSGGEAMELGDVAQIVARRLGGWVERAAVSDDAADVYVGDGGTYERLLARYGVSSISLADQIAETASFLAPFAGRSVGRMIDAGRKGAAPPQAQSASHAGRSANSR